MNDFSTALTNFLTAANSTAFKKVNDDMADTFPKGYYDPLTTEAGSKFVRVVSSRLGNGRSVWCFVEKATGDILKAEGWKKPSKIKRGYNIFKPETYEGKMDAYGSWLYRR
jgi:hypothetical protein